MNDIPLPEGLEQRMSALIDALDARERRAARRRRMGWLSAAAVLAIVAGIGIGTYRDRPDPHEVTDPEEARRQTEQALMAMSEALNRGLTQVEAARMKVADIEEKKNICKLIQY